MSEHQPSVSAGGDETERQSSAAAPAAKALPRLEMLDPGTLGVGAPMVCDIDDPHCEVGEGADSAGAILGGTLARE